MIFFATSNSEWLTILGGIFGLATVVFWMVVGLRASRAHERLADSHEALAKIANVIAVKQLDDVEATVVPVRAAKPAIPAEPEPVRNPLPAGPSIPDTY